MIAADTSALVAIALGESKRWPFLKTMLENRTALISTVSVIEMRMLVHARRGERAVVVINDLLRLCMKVRSVPLLFKGDDFSHTDLIPACEPQHRPDPGSNPG